MTGDAERAGANLTQVLGVAIDPDLLELALTHRSYAYEHGGLAHNERLEFLGDSILGQAVTVGDAGDPVPGREQEVQARLDDPQDGLDAPAPSELRWGGRRHGGDCMARGYRPAPWPVSDTPVPPVVARSRHGAPHRRPRPAWGRCRCCAARPAARR